METFIALIYNDLLVQTRVLQLSTGQQANAETHLPHFIFDHSNHQVQLHQRVLRRCLSRYVALAIHLQIVLRGLISRNSLSGWLHVRGMWHCRIHCQMQI